MKTYTSKRIASSTSKIEYGLTKQQVQELYGFVNSLSDEYVGDIWLMGSNRWLELAGGSQDYQLRYFNFNGVDFDDLKKLISEDFLAGYARNNDADVKYRLGMTDEETYFNGPFKESYRYSK